MSDHGAFKRNSPFMPDFNEQMELPINPPVQKVDKDYLVPQSIRQTAVDTQALKNWVDLCSDIDQALADKQYGEAQDLLAQLQTELLECQ